jgi:hypothetical protein
MDGLIDPFYESCEPALEPGHIWCDQPIYLPARHGLKITRVDPSDDSKLDYKVCGRTEEIFDHAPVASLKMESTEGAVVAKTKRNRPVIVIGGMHASELLGRADRTTHAEIAMVVPVYKAEQYSDAMRRRMQTYDIANVFYLPAASSLAFKEGFARLDHVQAVPQARLSKHRGLKLSEDALAALIEWLTTLLTGQAPTDSMIDDYRNMVMQSKN